jgi:hypothetical protein
MKGFLGWRRKMVTPVALVGGSQHATGSLVMAGREHLKVLSELLPETDQGPTRRIRPWLDPNDRRRAAEDGHQESQGSGIKFCDHMTQQQEAWSRQGTRITFGDGDPWSGFAQARHGKTPGSGRAV